MKNAKHSSDDPSTDGDTLPEAGSHRQTTTRRWALRAVNVWLVFHLAAIVIAPASVSPSSSLAQGAWEVVRPYLQLLHLNHGYHFFAPEPAASTLVAYTVHRDDGTIISGRIPNRDIHPRLLYHRHFMLTEYLTFAPAEHQELVYRTYAGHLCRRYGGGEVGLARVTHYLPLREAVLNGARLDDPATYAEEPLGTYHLDEL